MSDNENAGIAQDVLRAAAQDLKVASAPVQAIMAGGRRRQVRTRMISGAVLGTAVALTVAVGAATTHLGPAGGASAASGPAPAATTAVPPARTAAADRFAGDYGSTVVMTGELGGTSWKLVRELYPATAGADLQGALPCHASGGTVEKTYIQTADGKKARAHIGSVSCNSDLAAWDHSWTGPIPGWSIVGLAAADGQPSPYGTLVLGQVNQAQIARVELKFSDGRVTQTAKLVKAPSPETDTYFVFSLPDKNLKDLPGMLVYYDAAGHEVRLPAIK